MTDTFVKDSLIAQIGKLPYDLQLRVLDFVKALAPTGVRGDSLIRFGGTIPVEDLKAMSQAIERSCENVDINEW
jgi:hypothetical protein